MEDRVSSNQLLNPRKPVIWLVAIAAGAALFASGGLVTRAMMDDSDDPPASNDPTGIIEPGIGSRSNEPTPNFRPGDSLTTKGGGASADSASYPGCRAPLPAGVVAGGIIDLSKAGFAPAMPGSGFTAVSVSLSVQGECKSDGTAVTGDLVLASSWTHTSSGLDAFVSQTATAKKAASVLSQYSAAFWLNGYVFNLNVNPYRIMTGVDDTRSSAPASTNPSGPGAGSSGSAGSPAIAPSPEADAQAEQVLRELIAQIAPTLDQKCFWVQGAGDWAALAAVGVGDPRPAIPDGFTQTDVNVTALTPPPAGCDTSIKPTEGFNLNANWQKNTNSSDYAYVGVSVYSTGGRDSYPGQLSEYGANWSNESFAFSVYAKSEKPVGIDTIRAIAKALDPAFNDSCFISDRELAQSELGGLGLTAAKAPGGYKLIRSSLRANEIAASCPKPEGFQPSYGGNWSFQKGADTIEAAFNLYGGQPSGDGSGYQSNNNFYWTNAKGVNFSVSGYSSGISPTVSKDDLVSVAKSLDPQFDLAKLKEGGPEKPVDLPMPAPDKPR